MSGCILATLLEAARQSEVAEYHRHWLEQCRVACGEGAGRASQCMKPRLFGD